MTRLWFQCARHFLPHAKLMPVFLHLNVLLIHIRLTDELIFTIRNSISSFPLWNPKRKGFHNWTEGWIHCAPFWLNFHVCVGIFRHMAWIQFFSSDLLYSKGVFSAKAVVSNIQTYFLICSYDSRFLFGLWRVFISNVINNVKNGLYWMVSIAATWYLFHPELGAAFLVLGPETTLIIDLLLSFSTITNYWMVLFDYKKTFHIVNVFIP